jgi:hypothetical protein
MSAHEAGQLLRALDDVLLVSACRSIKRVMGEVGKLWWLGSKQADGGGPVGLGAAGPGGSWRGELSFPLVHGRQVKLMILATHSHELYKQEQEQREDTTACICGPRQA